MEILLESVARGGPLSDLNSFIKAPDCVFSLDWYLASLLMRDDWPRRPGARAGRVAHASSLWDYCVRLRAIKHYVAYTDYKLHDTTPLSVIWEPGYIIQYNCR